jgi:hypothetical protein
LVVLAASLVLNVYQYRHSGTPLTHRPLTQPGFKIGEQVAPVQVTPNPDGVAAVTFSGATPTVIYVSSPT